MKRTKESLKTIGERLRKNRKSKHFSQEEVAKCIEVDHTTISRYENGVIDIPVSTLIDISNLCGFEPRSCFNWESDGLDELQKLLEDCIKDKKNIKGNTKSTQTPICLSENSIDLVMTYELLKNNPAISVKTLKSLKEDIILQIEMEQGVDRMALYNRLRAYAERVNEKSGKKM